MKPVLVHVPKCAGSSMVRLQWLDYAGHATYLEAREMFGPDRFYFAVVRHPVNRFISCMAVVYENLLDYPLRVYEYGHEVTFIEFLESISSCLETVAKDPCLKPVQKVLFRSQSEQLGSIPCVIFYEDLYAGIGMISRKFDMGFHFNQLQLQHLGKINFPKPRLSLQTIQLIKDYYHNDMVRYGYK